jgi:hypothetical protein
MNPSSIMDVSQTTDRYKLFVMSCLHKNLSKAISFLKSHNINAINIGKELAEYISGLEDYSYLSIDVHDHAKKILENHKSKINNTGNDIVAVYNLGILLEPALELNAIQLLREFSKSSAIIIIWENQFDNYNRLNWPTNTKNVFLDFSETQLKTLQYAI